ncbi:MAG: patatin-like phospholipase family protein [Clostridia bacterium]|nr:patatin-like phospholipase family protein [Clostridia bacterium]
MGFFSWLLRKKAPAKIKLGLALGSGGAKGFAHLGALKAFEENGIEFDVIAGTSIGSIVGAFYADGYSSTDIMELLKRVNFGEVTNLFMMQMDTSGLYNVIKRELGDLEFSQLKKPFKAVATVLETGEEKVFDSGSVAKALCASSCIPPFFKPVIIDGVRYVDGAYSNAIPADLVRNMGADYVVAIDLATKESKLGVLKKLFPTYQSRVENPSRQGYEFSDVTLHPDLNEFSSVSISGGSFMYDIGYHHALSFIPKIKEDLQRLRSKKLKKR